MIKITSTKEYRGDCIDAALLDQSLCLLDQTSFHPFMIHSIAIQTNEQQKILKYFPLYAKNAVYLRIKCFWRNIAPT